MVPGLRRGQRLHGLSGRADSLLGLLQGDLLDRGEGGQMSRVWWRIVAMGVLAAVLVTVVTPYLWLIMTSFKSRLDALADAPVWLFTPTFEHYPTVFLDKEYLPLVLNSLVVACTSTGLS